MMEKPEDEEEGRIAPE
ncbi:hypothetical protein A2U01_0104348, partial [Trifolium medium]|nr:hypothetical protein [Trifolium medium]